MQGFSGHWWQSLFDDSIPSSHATEIRSRRHLLALSGALVGALASLLSLSLSMAFRRRFPGDGVLFYVIMLALMTPGLPAQPRHVALLAVHGQGLRLAEPPHEFGGLAAIGTGVVWAIPFGFLVMVAVWNRYDVRVEEAARDLGASSPAHVPRGDAAARSGRVSSARSCSASSSRGTSTTGPRSSSPRARSRCRSRSSRSRPARCIRPDLYALGTATTIFILVVVAIVLVAAAIRPAPPRRRRAGAARGPGSRGARRGRGTGARAPARHRGRRRQSHSRIARRQRAAERYRARDGPDPVRPVRGGPPREGRHTCPC